MAAKKENANCMVIINEFTGKLWQENINICVTTHFKVNYAKGI